MCNADAGANILSGTAFRADLFDSCFFTSSRNSASSVHSYGITSQTFSGFQRCQRRGSTFEICSGPHTISSQNLGIDFGTCTFTTFKLFI
ncbi:unnamed protein product [Tilletia controversa]|nr:unnamed protein product [Tilletia controversa]CAD6983103.1 unnamed protein product [Tilletia controversa]